MDKHNCPVCGTKCTIVGHTTKHYEPVEAPKNELIPLNFQELNKFVMDYRKFSSFKGDDNLVSAICERFGSSGKRLDKSKLKELFEGFYEELDCHHLDIIDAICKEFSTAEVRLEAIEKKIIDEVVFIEIPEPPTNGTEWFYVNGRFFTINFRTIAKAIKRELENKNG